jgi:hypothetical protein
MARIRVLAASQKRVFPSGMAAANMLGFTSRIPSRIELATTATSLPHLFDNVRTIVHTRRPAKWRHLSETDGALLEFLRSRGIYSALTPEETVEKLLYHFREPGRYERLFAVMKTEPPRVRAMLGAIGEQLGQPDSALFKLGETLRSVSRYDFGILAALPCARRWLVKGHELPAAVFMRKPIPRTDSTNPPPPRETDCTNGSSAEAAAAAAAASPAHREPT